MRTIDVSKLQALGSDGTGPWRLEDGRLLRVATGGRPLATPEEAQSQLEAYNAAQAAGARTPEAYEVVHAVGCRQGDGDLAEGYGVVVEFVPGVALATHILFGSYGLEEAAAEVGRMQRKLHGLQMGAGHDWNAEFALWARCMAMLLPCELGGPLVELVEAIPPSNALLHGDLHVANVIVSHGELTLIDMEFAGFGNPVLDLGISHERIFCNAPRDAERAGIPREQVSGLTQRMWDSQLRGYLGEVGQDALDEATRRIQVVSEVERCGLSCNIATLAEREPTGPQRRVVAESAEVLGPLLLRLTHLDLEDVI